MNTAVNALGGFVQKSIFSKSYGKTFAVLVMLGISFALAGCLPQTSDVKSPPSGAGIAVASPATELVLPAPSVPTRLPDSATKVVSTNAVAALRAEIVRNEQLAEKYRSFADSVDSEFHIGTYFNELNVKEHSCYALGQLLGHADEVKNLRVSGKVDLASRTSENALELRMSATSLENFALVAKDIIDMPLGKRALAWNLDCVGKYGIVREESQAGVKTFYELENEGRVLRVLGNIEKGFSDRLIDAIERNPGVKQVALGSGGGLVAEAIRAGLYIRAKRLDTTLWNGCYSACPLVFFSGVNRMMWSPYPVLGFHQVSKENGRAVSLDDPVYTTIADYTNRMGVDSRYVLRSMWAASPTGMNEVNGNQDILCKSRVTTWIQRGCSTE